jgi:hypothetical protein
MTSTEDSKSSKEAKKFWRLELDYDKIPRQTVEEEAKRLISEYAELGDTFRIENSKSGTEHFHLIFPKSQFTNFQEAYDIAAISQADPDWLYLCKLYECFGLETEASRHSNQVRQEQHPITNKPVRNITSPIVLNLHPATALDVRRIVKLCEVIKDDTWQYTSRLQIWNQEHHVLIGCIDDAQAIRRLQWLGEKDIKFSAKIEQNPPPPVEQSSITP